MMKTSILTPRILCVGIFAAAFFAAPVAFAGDWGVHLSPHGWGFHYGDRDSHISIDTGPRYVRPYPQPYPYTRVRTYPRRYYPSGPYYPNYNPVVRRDVEEGATVAPDGTVHSETRVEDRRASYYSPGRNEAITPPETSVTRRLGPDGVWREVEHTRWIGADGRPHSTTIERDTVQNIWGDTHTDTHVTLKNVQGGADQSGKQPAGKKPAAPKKQQGGAKQKQK